MRVQNPETQKTDVFERVFPVLGVVAVIAVITVTLFVSVRISPAWACPPGQIEDMQFAVCSPEKDGASWALVNSRPGKETRASPTNIEKVMMVDLQQPYLGRETYLVDEQGSWFLRLEAGSNCTHLYVIKGWSENGEPAISHQPWFKRVMSLGKSPQVFYASISDYISERIYEMIHPDDDELGGFLTRMHPWGMAFFETDTWYRLQIHSNELKQLIVDEYAKNRLKTVVFNNANYVVGGDFELLDTARIRRELRRTDQWPRANSDLFCSLIRSNQSRLQKEAGLTQTCAGKQAKITETRVPLRQGANEPKADVACEALLF